jgi:hypothetical protein
MNEQKKRRGKISAKECFPLQNKAFIKALQEYYNMEMVKSKLLQLNFLLCHKASEI